MQNTPIIISDSNHRIGKQYVVLVKIKNNIAP